MRYPAYESKLDKLISDHRDICQTISNLPKSVDGKIIESLRLKERKLYLEILKNSPATAGDMKTLLNFIIMNIEDCVGFDTPEMEAICECKDIIGIRFDEWREFETRRKIARLTGGIGDVPFARRQAEFNEIDLFLDRLNNFLNSIIIESGVESEAIELMVDEVHRNVWTDASITAQLAIAMSRDVRNLRTSFEPTREHYARLVAKQAERIAAATKPATKRRARNAVRAKPVKRGSAKPRKSATR